ncbi:hypothetical protein CRUP_015418 [Coryphaenoides rupestris]|nr:hypothetical protein CRUP_015418 [Coryphaenoides rupestris]
MDELDEALKRKEDDMKQNGGRYKKYLEKAKSKENGQDEDPEGLLRSKPHRVSRLVTTMGISLQKKAVEDRLANTGSGQSFLARQRQATSTRRSYPGHVQPATTRWSFNNGGSLM